MNHLEHSAILLTCIKRYMELNSNFLSFLEWLFYTGFTSGRAAQSVTFLATNASLTADARVPSSIPARSHTFVEIDYELIYADILLPFAESFKKDCCQLQAKVCA